MKTCNYILYFREFSDDEVDINNINNLNAIPKKIPNFQLNDLSNTIDNSSKLKGIDHNGNKNDSSNNSSQITINTINTNMIVIIK